MEIIINQEKLIQRLTKCLFFVFILTNNYTINAENIYVNETKFSVNIQQEPLRNIIKWIEDNSEFVFIYRSDIDLDKIINVDFKNSSINEILNCLQQKTNFEYQINNHQIIIRHKETKRVSLEKQYAEQRKMTVRGIVKDTKGDPIIGASIIQKGTTNGTISDIDGKFTLGVHEGDILQISFIGYKTIFVTVNSPSCVIKLKEDAEMLEEVVVTGYGGTQIRSKVTNSIASVKQENLAIGLFSNPAQALSGSVSGLRVVQSSGNPSASPRIVLRGGTNLDGSGSPLVVVDGQLREDMSDINPEDIESMDVLKDAGATAIYGARANNGVILISTKRGKEGTTQIGIKTKIGFNYLNTPYEFMNAGDYIWWMRTAYQRSSQIFKLNNGRWTGIQNLSTLKAPMPYGTGNIYWADANKKILASSITDNRASYSPMIYTDDLAFLLDQGWQTMIDPVYGEKIIYKEYTSSENIKSPAISQDYNVNFSGGNQKGSYYTNVGYNKTEGLPKGLEYNRITAILNADYQIKPWLKSAIGISFINSKRNALPNGSTSSKYNEDLFFTGLMSQPPTMREDNPTANLSINSSKYYRNFTTNRWTMSENLTFIFLKGLSLKLNAMFLFDEIFNESSDKDIIKSGGNVNTTRATSAYFQRDIQQTYNTVLNYGLNIKNRHYIDAMAGFEFYDFRRKGFSAAGSGAPTEDFGDLGLTTSAENKRIIDSWHERQRIMSAFGKINYDYLGKYLFSFTFRQDGYSILLNDNRWGMFPGASVGWIMSKEPIMQKLQNIISFAKLRASYGINGNVSNISGDYVRNGAYDLQGSYLTKSYNGKIGFVLGNLANTQLRWEKSHTFEIGLDFSLFDNQINTNLTYYNRRTTDKYADIPLAGTAGIDAIRTNNGEIRNQGLEFDLGFRLVDKKNWAWNLNINGAYNKNKILKLPYNGLKKNRQNAFQVYSGHGNELIWVGGYQEGEEPGALYVFKAEGIYQTEQDIPGNLIDKSSGDNGSNGLWLYGPELWNNLPESQKVNENGTPIALPIQPGDVRWKDVNNDGVIDNYDKVKVGNKIPRITGGVNTSLRYKDITLFVKMDYGLGHKILDPRTPWIMGNMVGLYNTLELTKDTWSPSNPNGKYPIYTWADQLGKRNYARESSMFVYKGDYLAFREICLSYQVPQKVISKLGINKLELSVIGQNLGYWTAAKTVYNPEVSDGRDIWSADNGTDRSGGYPLPRTLILGLNATF